MDEDVAYARINTESKVCVIVFIIDAKRLF